MKLKNICDRELKFSICEILLGLNLENSSLSYCINTVIIWGNGILINTKAYVRQFSQMIFLKIIKSKFKILEKVYSKEKKIDKFNKVYRTLCDSL